MENFTAEDARRLAATASNSHVKVLLKEIEKRAREGHYSFVLRDFIGPLAIKELQQRKFRVVLHTFVKNDGYCTVYWT